MQRGRELLQTFACRRCHTVEGRGNRLASHLDRLSVRTGPEEISAAIEAPAIFMPHFHVNKRQLADLVNVILAAGTRGRGAGKEPPQVVHFEESGRAGENVFDEKCGPCHKILSSTGGGLGRGEIGPNLSGLFTSHYPVRPPYRGWTRERLATWLENPRRVRGATPMRPVPLQKEEFAKLAALLR